MSSKIFSNVIGFDDAPFPRSYQGLVKIVGAVFAGQRFDGVLIGEIEKDGSDAAKEIIRIVAESKFAAGISLIMLQGITMGGFNVIDPFTLHRKLALPVLVVTRRQPNLESIRKALVNKIPDGEKKWRIIERIGPMEPVEKIFIQRVGLTMDQAAQTIRHFTIHSHIPEPIRTAHLIAGAIADGQSRGCP